MNAKTPSGNSGTYIRFATPSRPGFGGSLFRPGSVNEERLFWRPGLSFRFQRYAPTAGVRPQRRSAEGTSSPALPFSQCVHVNNSGRGTQGPSEDHKSSSQLSIGLPQEKEVESLSFTIHCDHLNHASPNGHDAQGGKIPTRVTRAAARNKAIQQKWREIEEVYKHDCNMFGIVVKMLIAKDPSLEQPIQVSFKQNLQDIRLRCVGAMQQFIEEYDLEHTCPLTSPPCSKS